MNCAGCGHRNRDRARFCLSCGEALGQCCARCSADCPPGARFCDCCGLRIEAAPSAVAEHPPRGYTPNHLTDEILGSERAIEGERKHVTVLFADVLGSMELAGSVDAEEWHRIMDRFFAILSDGVHRFEGTINQFTGDGIMALFGAPIAHEDHAQRACWAALHLGEELRRYAEELKRAHGLAFSVRMGINSGEVVVGTIGDDLRRDYTAQGPMVGLAARVEQLADPGTVYLSEHTAALVSGFFELRDLGAFDLKGVRGAVHVHQLLGPGPVRTRLDLSRARGFSRFVGRADEMGALEAALERVIAGSGQVVGVVAEAGVGKSRLCFEFAERCRSRGILVREAHAVAHGKMIPFRPVLEMLRGFFGVNQRDGDAVARQKIAGAVLLTDPDLTEGLPILFDFLGVPDPVRPAPRLDPEARQKQLLGIVTRLIQALSRREPVVFLLEDLHWMDAGSASFLEHLVEVVTGTRILILVNFRPDFHAEWMEKSTYQQLPLRPLGDDATRELLDDLLGADPGVRDLARTIRDRTGGNPFFIEEVVQSLVDSGKLEGSREAYRLATPVERLSVPPTVQAVLASRIDRLEDRQKRVLQTASVVGRSFSVPLLARVLELPEEELEEAVRALAQAEFVFEEALYPVEVYAFKHPLTHEVAYGSQLAERRAAIHAAVARALEELHPEKLDEQAALLAHHAEAAGEPLQAARWHRRAAEWVGIRDPAAAHRHWRTVLALIGDTPDSEEKAELGLLARTWLLQLAWRLGFSKEETARIFATGVALAERAGNPSAVVGLTLGYAVYRGVSGDEEAQHRHACEAARLADRLQDLGLFLAARGAIATSLQFLGRLGEGIEVAGGAISRASGDPAAGVAHFWTSPYTYLRGLRGLLLSLTGRLDEGERDLERALELARASEEVEITACVHTFQVQHACCAGDPACALAHGRRAVDLAQRTGIPLLLADAHRSLGNALVLAGQWSEAAVAAEAALEIVQDRKIMTGPRPRILLTLAEASLGGGDPDRARRLAAEVVASSRARHTALIELGAHLVLARAALHGEGSAAAESIQEALSSALGLVEKTNAQSLRPRVHLVLSEVAQLAGDEPNRQRQLREAQRLYAEMGAAGHVERIARALSETSGREGPDPRR